MPYAAWPLLTLPTLSPNALLLIHSTLATPATGQGHSYIRAFAHTVPSTGMPFSQFNPWCLLLILQAQLPSDGEFFTTMSHFTSLTL